ncbi:MAG: NAD(P)H-dependent oxidoreductase [Pseudonocardiaceae bacterium]|nr:NAD(P)H-dependent oxidoreductase [Pseudonocardiaceae bacterium]
MRVVGLCGSLRRDSYNRRLLRVAGGELPRGVTFEVFEGLGDVPPYNQDLDAPPPVLALREAISTAGAVLISTPEYNGSVPGQLKNSLDWASRPFPDNVLRGKPVAVVGASTGLFGAVWAQAELRKVLTTIGARVVDEELPVGQAHDAFTAEGGLADPDLRTVLGTVVDRLLDDARSRTGVSA